MGRSIPWILIIAWVCPTISRIPPLGLEPAHTDALDRFSTRLEHRFTTAEIKAVMEGAVLVRGGPEEAAPLIRHTGGLHDDGSAEFEPCHIYLRSVMGDQR